VAHSSTSTVEAAGTDIASRTFWPDEAAGSTCARHAFDALVTFVALGACGSRLSIVASFASETAGSCNAGGAWQTLWSHRSHWPLLSAWSWRADSDIDQDFAFASIELGTQEFDLGIKRLDFCFEGFDFLVVFDEQ